MNHYIVSDILLGGLVAMSHFRWGISSSQLMNSDNLQRACETTKQYSGMIFHDVAI